VTSKYNCSYSVLLMCTVLASRFRSMQALMFELTSTAKALGANAKTKDVGGQVRTQLMLSFENAFKIVQSLQDMFTLSTDYTLGYEA